jgi:hypothetical protein
MPNVAGKFHPGFFSDFVVLRRGENAIVEQME